MSAAYSSKGIAAICAMTFALVTSPAYSQEVQSTRLPTIADCPPGYVLGVQDTNTPMPLNRADPSQDDTHSVAGAMAGYQATQKQGHGLRSRPSRRTKGVCNWLRSSSTRSTTIWRCPMSKFIPLFADRSHPVVNEHMRQALACPECSAFWNSLTLMIEGKSHSPRYVIICDKCKFVGPFGRSLADAVKRWNKSPSIFTKLRMHFGKKENFKTRPSNPN